MRINSSIFRKYDIRGRFPEEINERAVYLVGRGFCRFLDKEELVVAVGRDRLNSSRLLKQGVIRSVVDSGHKAVDIGLSSTPMLCFAVAHFEYDGGLQLTASHLSDEGYSGVKIMGRGGVPVGKGNGLEKIEEMIEGGEIVFQKKEGRAVKKNILSEYVRELKKRIDELPGLKVVMDAGNGMAGLCLEKVFEDTPLEVVPLFWEVDPELHTRGANPKLAENREPLKKAVKKNEADLGFMWDEDGDRFYALDSRGEVIDPSFVSLLIGAHLMRKTGNKKMVVDIRTSKVVEDEIRKAGGEVVHSKAWHPEIKKKMRETGAVFGSETSGHYIFKDFYFIDDGVLASLYFLEAVAELDQPLDQYLKDLKSRYFILPETNFEVEDGKEVEKILKRMEKFYEKKGGETKRTDGLSVDFDEWHFNLRPSQTESVVRLNMEAGSRELLKEKKDEVAGIVREVTG